MQSVNSVVIRFSGDSGDGMQLTGTQFSNTSAFMGNDLSTFPDFPAEIRAPQGTVAGISGFQVNIGSTEISTPGDAPDVLVAMNPAALKANISDLKKGAIIIINIDAFTSLNLKKAEYETNPLETHLLDDFMVIKANITSQTKEALESLDLDTKLKVRCKNFYALGMTYFMYSRDLEPTEKWIAKKFEGKETLIQANIMALNAGYHFADTIEAFGDRYVVEKATIEKGLYRQINGNTALAWGLVNAADKAGVNLFLGSYPITPASDILHELSSLKSFGVKTFQAEDEIAGISAAIGASFGGALGITTSSGPGIALKSEALNLAMIYELPLIVVDVQRGGPSTGLPTKTEQSDLNMAMYGRNGESPLIVLAAKTPSDCFHMAFEAARLTLEHMTPVMLLTDGFIANGSEPWRIPNVNEKYKNIDTKFVDPSKFSEDKFLPYLRDEKLVRKWATPGMENVMHRIGGLEKQVDTGNVSYDPENHQKMVDIRAKKVELVSSNIPIQLVEGAKCAQVLVVSWGGTYGATHQAVKELNEENIPVSLVHISYINPMPSNLEDIFKNYKSIVVCELNKGQMRDLLASRYDYKFDSYTKVQGKPFQIRELKGMIESKIEGLK